MNGATTQAVRDALAAGRLLDGWWTIDVTVRLADLYFEADAAYERTDWTCPDPWQAAFAAGLQPATVTTEHAILGISAHSVYDLPLAVAETLTRHGDVDGEGGSVVGRLARRRFDYDARHLSAAAIE